MVALPALRVVERAFPTAQRLMLTNFPVHAKAPAASAVLDGTGLVHGYLNYPVGTRSIRDLARVWRDVRRFRPEVLVYLVAPRGEKIIARDANFFRWCGIRKIVGLPTGELGNNLFDPRTQIREGEAARLLRCVRPLGEAQADDLSLWDLRLGPAEEEKAEEVLSALGGGPLIACGPGTKMQAKDWGQENWRALLDRITAAMPGATLVLVGAKEDAEASEYAAGGWHGPAANLCGKLALRETAAVLKRAELFLGPDSGPMHLAAAYGVPCAIAFAARAYAGIWFPAGTGHRVVYHTVACANCGLESCIVRKKICLTSISVDEMFEAAMAAWNNGQQERNFRFERSTKA